MLLVTEQNMEAQETEFVSHVCPTCGGASHPSNGCAYTSTFVVCERCVREFWVWVEQFTNGKGARRGVRFYDHVEFQPCRIETERDDRVQPFAGAQLDGETTQCVVLPQAGPTS